MLRKSLGLWLLASCFALSSGSIAVAQEAVPPWFLVIFDTSGSMGNDAGGNNANSCGYCSGNCGGVNDPNKIDDAKCALFNILNSTGDAEFGLAQFDQGTDCSYTYPTNTCDYTSGSGLMREPIASNSAADIMALVDGTGAAHTQELCAAGNTPLGGSLALAAEYFQGALGAPFTAPTVNDAALGCRPMNVILLTDGQEFCSQCDDTGGDAWPLGCPDAATDPDTGFSPACATSCTGSDGTGGGDYYETAPERAYELRTGFNGEGRPDGLLVPRTAGVDCAADPTNVDCVSVPVRTYVIGFGISQGDRRIENIARAGGTDNPTDGPGNLYGFYPANEAELSEALARIIFDAQLIEVCNGVDDNCDGVVDEGYEAWCDIDAIRTENPMVPDPDTGMLVDQATIEGSNLASYTCSNPPGCGPDSFPFVPCCEDVPGVRGPYGPGDPQCETPTEKAMCSPENLLCESPGERCDYVDNDCDGEIDELDPGEMYVGTPPTEVCFDQFDNDCDGDVDEGCDGCAPETCDGEDDDCDGEIDEELFQACGFELDSIQFPNSTCRAGQRVCVLGEWGAFCPTGMPCNVDDSTYDRSCTNPGPTTCTADFPAPSDFVQGEGTCVEPTSETCDGLDNNCNTIIDDVPPVACNDALDGIGVCRAGQQFCDPSCDPGDSGCDPTLDDLTECRFFVGPSDEICDARDNDCDGTTDENEAKTGLLTRSCGANIGICPPGTETCNDMTGVYEGCTAMPLPDPTGLRETCNGSDDDCDGRTDERDDAIPGSCVPDTDGSPLTPGPNDDRGQCELGDIVCTSGALVCINYQGPGTELCDGLDRDCDGSDFNGVGPLSTDGDPRSVPAGTDPDLGQACFPYDDNMYPGYPQALRGRGQCTPGVVVCDVSDTDNPVENCVDFGLPSDEACDGIDNDCDGRFDEDVYGPSDTCRTDPGPLVEFCGQCLDVDGEIVVCRDSLVDGDGDDQTTDVDAGCDDLGYGTPQSHGSVPDCCSTRAFSTNWQYGNTVGPYLTTGDATCREGRLACVLIDNVATEICDGEILPDTDTCDGLDNDCDGMTDEFIPTEGQACKDDDLLPGPITGVCEAGQLSCSANPANMDTIELWCSGFMGPRTETCNFQDDDCDGFTDERNPGGGAACGGNTTGPTACQRNEDPLDSGSPLVPCGECSLGVLTCVPIDSSDATVESLSFLDPDAVDSDLRCLNDVGPSPEVCDGSDNDCDSPCLVMGDGTVVCPPGTSDDDRNIDEGVDVTDPQIGMQCGETDEGPCELGMWTCVAGGYSCEGEVKGTDEVCDGIDNNCNGMTDEGIPLGESCFDMGPTPDAPPQGQCAPGKIACDPATGEEICIEQVGPTDEICDGRDNDCDGMTDEDLGLGEECGTDVGLCEKGRYACADGQLICQGEVTPSPETCDCSDNDCDGEIDEETGGNPLCPGGSACIMCQCALPCVEGMEFSAQCPQGKAAVTVEQDGEDACYCVGEQCRLSACAEETIEVGDDVVCQPDSDLVAACTCKNNECTSVCSGVVCEGGLVCDQTDGRCKQPSCLLKQFECPSNQRCQLTGASWSCVDDPCADRECGGDEACREGVCVKSCAKVDCSMGNKCVDGTCVTDPCFGKQCAVGEVCNPADGDCVLAGECVRSGCADGEVCDPVGGECGEDPCLGTRCPHGERCNSASSQCELRCAGNLLFCDDACINPQTSKSNCGASGDCQGDSAGASCGDDEVCSRGECSDTCADGLLNCGGECIDPQGDQMHCGASGDCQGDDAGSVCQTGFVCMSGRCRSILGDGDGPSTGSEADIGTRVIASGGGGCTCTVPVGAVVPAGDAPASKRGPLALALVGLALIALGRRRRFGWVRAVGPTQLVLLAILALTLLAGGCKVDPFCLDCPSEGSLTDPGQDGGTNGIGGGDSGTGNSGQGGNQQGDGDGDNTNDPMMRPDGGDAIQPDACGLIEVCNGIDDDCDGTTDEDVDPAAQGLDYDTDINNCGGCGNVCRIEHAFAQCTDAECKIDRTQGEDGCDVGWHDLNRDESDGCEYRCTQSASDDAICDRLDNDCDGEVDEDIDFDTDTSNCGSCGRTCFFSNAAAGATCIAGVCVLDDANCDHGFRNLDGIDQNGCEWQCAVPDPIDELCNGVDDDCDGRPDEGVADTDPMIGRVCGSDVGECETGIRTCQGGQRICAGQKLPAPNGEDICDTLDNDCDMRIDENDVRTGGRCGTNVGACAFGENVCVDGEIECGGANIVRPAANETCNFIDDDCDGNIDEHVFVDTGSGLEDIEQAGGVTCSALTGSVVIAPATPAVGLCQYGTLACRGGALECDDEVGPAGERCDNLDHDCDGMPVPTDLDELIVSDPAIGPACSNQLGICGQGVPGTWECVDTGSGTPNWERRCGEGSVSAIDETCDGRDEDCNGTVDDGIATEACPAPGATILCDDSVVSRDPLVKADPTCRCTEGETFCSGGQVGCLDWVGPLTQELCNGIDDDCDGTIDENARQVGDQCADIDGDLSTDDPYNILGACRAGEVHCVDIDPGAGVTKALRCEDPTSGPAKVTPAAQEVCNNIDDDCDGQIDNGWVPQGAEQPAGTVCCPQAAMGMTCYDPGATPVQAGICEQGAIECEAGVVKCIQTGWNPSPEVCDTDQTRDNDCDGNFDEDFVDGSGDYTGRSESIAHCGGCGIDCRDDPRADTAAMACIDSVCQIAACLADYYDDPDVGGTDCELYCPGFLGANTELCDGVDNDCDGDLDADDADIQPPTAATFCDQDGACNGAVPVCTDVDPGPGTLIGWSCDILPYTEGGIPIDRCNYDVMTDKLDPADGVNDDCDGKTDENDVVASGFQAAGLVRIGEDCFGPGTGACRRAGKLACSTTTPGQLVCVDQGDPSTPLVEDTGAATNEVCDGEDNDCDGVVDEPCPCNPGDTACLMALPSWNGTLGEPTGCVVDDWVELDSGAFMFTYEASKPDALVDNVGSARNRACSQGNVLPWTQISYADAKAACEAIDDGAGRVGRLCTRAEWLDGCDCTGTQWNNNGGCETDEDNSPCNFYDSDSDPGPGTTGPTGSFVGCYSADGAHDMNGNVKELTQAQLDAGGSCDPETDGSTCRIMVRGGAANNFQVGASCGYAQSYWPNDAPFPNVGFRCCIDPVP